MSRRSPREGAVEQVALRIQKTDGWTYLGGDPDAKKPLEVVFRAFEGDVLAATGETGKEPASESVLVPAGEGRRLEGRHFFARPARPDRPVLMSYRGL
jgi:hypothetical protein